MLVKTGKDRISSLSAKSINHDHKKLFNIRLKGLAIKVKGIARCKLTIISKSAICEKFLGQIVPYSASL
jgi:hypothetical protein